MNSRVFVTGLGAVSAFGLGVNALWQGCMAGDSKTEPTPAPWRLYHQATSRVWSPLPPIDFSVLGFSRTEILTASIPSLLAEAASSEGMRQAEAEDMHLGSTIAVQIRAGVFLGTGFGGAKSPFDNYRAHLLGGLRTRFNMLLKEFPDDLHIKEQLAALKAHPRVNPMVICQSMPNAASAGVGIRYGLKGPNDTVCYACASGTVAIGRAFQAIQRGELDFAVAGGGRRTS